MLTMCQLWSKSPADLLGLAPAASADIGHARCERRCCGERPASYLVALMLGELAMFLVAAADKARTSVFRVGCAGYTRYLSGVTV